MIQGFRFQTSDINDRNLKFARGRNFNKRITNKSKYPWYPTCDPNDKFGLKTNYKFKANRPFYRKNYLETISEDRNHSNLFQDNPN